MENSLLYIIHCTERLHCRNVQLILVKLCPILRLAYIAKCTELKSIHIKLFVDAWLNMVSKTVNYLATFRTSHSGRAL